MNDNENDCIVETISPIGSETVNGISNIGCIGTNILEKINEEAFKRAQKLANFVADEARKHTENPLDWPLSFEVGEHGPIPNSSRIMDMLSEILLQHGLMAVSGPDFFSVDLMTNNYEDDDIEEINNMDNEEHEISRPQKVLREAPDAEKMFARAKEGLAQRTKETIDYVARRIIAAAEDGQTSMEISVAKPPISDHHGIVKRLALYLKDRGYIVKTNVPVKAGEKLDYSKVNTIIVSWTLKDDK